MLIKKIACFCYLILQKKTIWFACVNIYMLIYIFVSFVIINFWWGIIVSGVWNMFPFYDWLLSVWFEYNDVMFLIVNLMFGGGLWLKHCDSNIHSLQEFNQSGESVLDVVVCSSAGAWLLSEMEGVGLRLTDCLVHRCLCGPN